MIIARSHPELLAFSCPTEFVFAAEGDAKKLPTFKITAYDGKPMRVFSWMDPVVIDLEGLTFGQAIPVRRDHSPSQLVGHTDSIEVKGKNLVCTGIVSHENEYAREVVASAKNGFPWQASVGVQPTQVEYIPEGTTTTVNGMKVSGPVDIVRKGTLKEVSFVDLGASSGTKVAVAASATQGIDMDRLKELEAKLAGGQSLTAAEHAELLSLRARHPQATVPATTVPAPVQANSPAHAPTLSAADSAVNEIREKAGAETQRIADVTAAAGGNQVLAAKAIREGWTKDRTELEAHRAARPTAPAIHAGGAALTDDVVEAALCLSTRLRDVEKKFKPETLDAAHKRFRGRIGLQELLLEAAQANGYHGRSVRGDLGGVLRAAFSGVNAGFSTISLPGLLSNVQNKHLLESYNAIEQTWRQISAISPVTDFKTVTSYRLTGSGQFKKVGPGGELTHDTLGEQSFTNKAETYGRMFAITRQDMINDDLGALTKIPKILGRGAGLALNEAFWTEFLNNASFFASGNNNYFEGAGTTLQVSQLAVALQKFRDQTDVDGKPLSIAPAILLVPTALEVTAAALMKSTELRDTTASTKYPVSNPFAGMFTPAVSAYLSNALLTGNSSTAWYLLANPADLATIETVFLNGVEEPTIEFSEADFNTLGILMRGYFDFGVAKQETRAGVKSKGAA